MEAAGQRWYIPKTAADFAAKILEISKKVAHSSKNNKGTGRVNQFHGSR